MQFANCERSLMHAKHYIVPDLQLRQGVPTEHLAWIGEDIVRRKPDVIVQIGDWGDFPSLSSHDAPGSIGKEGARYEDDLEALCQGVELLTAPITAELDRIKRRKLARWKPRMIFTEGNHEYRIVRAINADPRFAGTIGPHHVQAAVERHGWEYHPFLKVVEADGIHYCLAPDHKVLTADLRHVRLGDVSVGDKLLAFDEHSPGPRLGRRYKEAVVERAEIVKAERKRVITSDGSEFLVTPNHKWLARRHGTTQWCWHTTDQLMPGIELMRPFNTWDRSSSYESGWLAGMFDGEGHLSKPNCRQGGIQIGIAQNTGNTLDRIREALHMHGAKYFEHAAPTGRVINIRVAGSSSEKLELLGRIRPMRLVEKFRPEMLGRLQVPDNIPAPTVVAIEDAPFGDVAKVQTSTGTMIVDGYAHHNCHYFQMASSDRPIGGSMDNRFNKICGTFVQGHEQGLLQHRRPLPTGKTIHGIVAGSAYLHSEEYRGPQRNNEWRGTVVLHDVRNDGDCDPMSLTLQYLCKKYEGIDLAKWMAKKYPNLPRGWAE